MPKKLDIPNAEDEALVRAAQKGAMPPYEELVHRHRDKIYARAFSMLRNEDEALEISQEAWVKGWQRLKQFKHNASFTTWMTCVCSLTHTPKVVSVLLSYAIAHGLHGSVPLDVSISLPVVGFTTARFGLEPVLLSSMIQWW